MADIALSVPHKAPADVKGRVSDAPARRRLVLWLPVAFGVGIAAYFGLAEEPAPLVLAAAVLLPALLAALASPGRLRLAAVALAVAGFGAGAAALRTAAVTAPVLAGPVTALVEGRVRALTQSAAGLPRLTLDTVTVYGLDAADTPRRVRVTLRRPVDGAVPGAWISVLADLAPPGGPVAPGAFDFRFAAWFAGLGATGTARSGVAFIPAARPPTAAERLVLAVEGVRSALSAGLRAGVGGEAGAFAAALVTGDRSGIPVEALTALRDSSLAHLLSISGLHMAIVCGLVFGAVRMGLVLVPGVALHWPVKRIAAVAALAAALVYLALSGGEVATQRSFLMAVVALGGVLAGRPALGMRGLALAALMVLALAPESLFSAAFQMSFAATLALLALYETARGKGWLAPGGGWGQWTRRYLAGLVLTSAVAGLATAAYGAWHFQRLVPYGLLANLAAVPVMGTVVAPALVLAGLLAPLGWEAPALRAAALGIGWMLDVARVVAALPGAVRAVPAAGPLPLMLITIGGLWLCLRLDAVRLWGLAPAAVGAALWATGPRPAPVLLIAPGGGLVAVRGPAGLVPDHPRANAFAAQTWLRRDGDLVTQADAAARPGWSPDGSGRRADLGAGWVLWMTRDRRVPAAAIAARCTPQTLILTPRARLVPPTDAAQSRRTVRSHGALAALSRGAPRSALPATAGPPPSSRPAEPRSARADDAGPVSGSLTAEAPEPQIGEPWRAPSAAAPEGFALLPGGCLALDATAISGSAFALVLPAGEGAPVLRRTVTGNRPWHRQAHAPGVGNRSQ